MSVIASYWRIPYFRRSLLLALFALFLGYFSVVERYLPALSQFEASLAALQAHTNVLAEQQQRYELAEGAEDLRAQLDALDARLSAGEERAAIVERFTELAGASGVRIIHGANQFGRERAGMTPVLHALSVEGSYASLRTFLAATRGLSTLTLLVSADISANPDGTVVRARLEYMTLSEQSL